MKINEYFDRQYIKIDPVSSPAELVIDEFIDNDDQSKFISPAESVYLHQNKRELFVVLNCLDLDVDEVRDACSKWQNNVLCFANFSSKFENDIKFLKFNITLLFLYKNSQSDFIDMILRTEKSLSVCKKMFIKCDSNGNLSEEDIILPFFFEPLYVSRNENDTRLEQELYSLLPQGRELQFVFLKNSFSTEQKNLFNRWLNANANN